MTAVQLIAPTDPALRRAVLALAPYDDELIYSNQASETLPAAEADPTRFPVAILDAEGTPVGFLVLDLGPRSRRYASGPHEIGVHGFFVDRRHRRRGLARAALRALPAYVAEHHAGISSIALTVNVDNAPAVAAYRAGGFSSSAERFLGGTHGPQFVMRVACG